MSRRRVLVFAALWLVAIGVMLAALWWPFGGADSALQPAPAGVDADWRWAGPLPAAGRVPVVVLSGGRRTCRKPEAGGALRFGPYMQRFRDFARDLARTGGAAASVVSCFADTHDEVFFDSTVTGDGFLRRPTDAFIGFLREIAAAADGRADFYIYGHSYGGWLATRAALALSADPSLARVRVLVTNDAISPEHCGVPTYVTFALQRITKLDFLSPLEVLGCNRFPTDLAAAELEALSGRVGTWTNVYQTHFKLLHSSAAPGAHLDLVLAYPWSTVNAHDATFIDPRALGLFERDTLRALSRNLGE